MNQRIIALWSEGEGHQAVGRLAEAERLFREVAELLPGNPHPLDRLAQVLCGLGRLEEASALAARAVAGAPLELVFHNTVATIADARGRTGQADSHFRRALILDPGIGLWPSLASLRFRAGAHRSAARAYRQALMVTPDDAGLMFEQAAALHGAGDTAEAYRGYHHVLARMSGHMPALRNLSVLASETGDEEAAENWLRRAVILVPMAMELLRELGVKALNRGDVARAFLLQRRTIRLDPDDALSWGALSDAGRRLVPQKRDSGGLRDLVACISRGIDAPNRLNGPAIALLRHEPGFLDACRSSAAAEPAALAESIARDGLPVSIDNAVLRQLMALSLLPDPDIEAGLTGIRRALLGLAAGGGLDGSRVVPEFIISLAEQCLLNEHAWHETPEETSLVVEMAREQAQETRWSPRALLLACYRPPISRDPMGDPSFERFEEFHVRSRMLERKIASAMTVLTRIEDGVSNVVREQYEENPYPRWTVLPHARPAMETDAGSAETDMLIAGCGTGQHALLTALSHPRARILAVDLSRASLAYAERMRRGYGIDHVTFAQADILGLGALDRRFDVIESIGVLHHMADPIEGWRVLAGLLKPDGIMRIGLYSETARQPVVQAREKIAGWGLDGTAPGIREARRRLMLERDDPYLAVLFFSPDFFSLSTCRDLLFHVQEHRFTIPQLRDAMQGLGLDFLGFELPSVILSRFRDRFAEDGAALDLARWEVFEAENPGCFGRMYQFRVGRGG